MKLRKDKFENRKKENVVEILGCDFYEVAWRLGAIRRCCEFIINNKPVFNNRSEASIQYMLKDFESIEEWAREASGKLYGIDFSNV